MVSLFTYGRSFFKNASASRYLIPYMLDMWFPCYAIIKDDTKQFCFHNFFNLLAIEFYMQSFIYHKASGVPYHIMCLFFLH